MNKTNLYLKTLELFQEKNPDLYNDFHYNPRFRSPGVSEPITIDTFLDSLGTKDDKQSLVGKDGKVYSYWAEDDNPLKTQSGNGWIGSHYDAGVSVYVEQDGQNAGKFALMYVNPNFSTFDIHAEDEKGYGISVEHRNNGVFSGIMAKLVPNLPKNLLISTGVKNEQTKKVLENECLSRYNGNIENSSYTAKNGCIVPVEGKTMQDLEKMWLNTPLGHMFADMGFFLQKGFYVTDQGIYHSDFSALNPLDHNEFKGLRDQARELLD